MKHSILIFIVLYNLVSCDQYREFIKEIDYSKTVTKDFKYDLLNPNKKYFMGYSLEEISGLSYMRNDVLACIQDESGKLYVYDTKKKTVIRRIKFHKGGDYEGVEVVGQKAYVMKSNGNLFVFPLDQGDKVDAKKIKTSFDIDNDVEGLGYNPKTDRFIIACKNEGGIDGKKVKGKAVYSFDIGEKVNKHKLLFNITKESIRDFLRKMNRFEENISFQPSAIAIHPIENRYYILSSSGKVLLIVSDNFKIEEYIKLKPAILHQPEGICFSPRGTMYISSEGDGQDGYILKYKYNK